MLSMWPKSWDLAKQNDALLQQFCVYTKNAIEESLRNREEGKDLEYMSYCLEQVLLTVLQMEYVGVAPVEFIATLGQLLLEVLESLIYCECQGRRQEFSDGGLTLPTRGLKYGFQGNIDAKNLRKIAIHLPTGASMLRRRTIAP